jgi:AAA15 family ATPase/GTPase
MIVRLEIQNFKCFKNAQSFPLSKVNLFTGYNGRGKSTVLQSLLLLAQSLYDNRNLHKLLVNGIFCNLGIFEDLLNFQSDDKSIRFTIESDMPDAPHQVVLSYEEYSARSGRLNGLVVDDLDIFETRMDLAGKAESTEKTLGNYPTEINKLFENFQFVSADRMGPTPFEAKHDLYDNNPVGNTGEYKLNVITERHIEKHLSESIQRIMDGGKMTVDGSDKANEVLKLYFTTLSSDHQVKAINSGFGYTYIIPILLSVLMRKDGCLFIENPEAHLHPCAQSRLMKELIRLARMQNVQLFVETHSEHIVNAMRLCILEEDYDGFSNEDVRLYFFDKDLSVKPLEVEPDAQIPLWPAGFFDQAERDAAMILKLGLLKSK